MCGDVKFSILNKPFGPDGKICGCVAVQVGVMAIVH